MVSQQDNTNLKGNNLVFEFLTSFKHMPGFWRENEYSLTIKMHLMYHIHWKKKHSFPTASNFDVKFKMDGPSNQGLSEH